MVVSNNGGFPKGKRRTNHKGEVVKVTLTIPKELGEEIAQISDATGFAKSKVLHKIVEMADLDMVADALYEEIDEAGWKIALADVMKKNKGLSLDAKKKLIQDILDEKNKK